MRMGRLQAGDSFDVFTRRARSSGAVPVPLPVDRVVRVVDEVSRTVQGLRIVRLSPTGAEFDRTMNHRTWGLRITLKFDPLASAETMISAWAEPKFALTLFDWGQGANDIRTLLEAIERQASFR
ncbi:hypothetical protein [Kribbella sp. NPDC023855]|uniref:hypothetical protein n=1 Tax=Kribbella sp. NPDC023855 TaxID=3154698 RepID=UPI0033E81D60